MELGLVRDADRRGRHKGATRPPGWRRAGPRAHGWRRARSLPHHRHLRQGHHGAGPLLHRSPILAHMSAVSVRIFHTPAPPGAGPQETLLAGRGRSSRQGMPPIPRGRRRTCADHRRRPRTGRGPTEPGTPSRIGVAALLTGPNTGDPCGGRRGVRPAAGYDDWRWRMRIDSRSSLPGCRTPGCRSGLRRLGR